MVEPELRSVEQFTNILHASPRIDVTPLETIDEAHKFLASVSYIIMTWYFRVDGLILDLLQETLDELDSLHDSSKRWLSDQSILRQLVNYFGANIASKQQATVEMRSRVDIQFKVVSLQLSCSWSHSNES